MTFDEFVAGRAADLLRFAVVLSGRRATAERLVVDALERTLGGRTAIDDPALTFAEARVWIVRGYLSEGMQLGAGPAADVDRPIVDATEADSDWDDLTARFVTSSRPQRTLTALIYYAGLDVDATASVMGSTSEGIALYLRRVHHDLNVRADDGAEVAGANSEADVRDLLEMYADDVDPDITALVEALHERLPDGEAERVEAERVEAERVEAERVEAERVEAERVEAERVEAERVEAERLEAERLEAERLEAERLEAERLEAKRAEAERLEAERLEAERLEAERLEAERLEAERLEAERLEAERLEAERLEAKRAEAERAEAERAEAERLETERVEVERVEAERVEAERAEAERFETERLEAERVEADRAEAERAEAQRESERVEAEREAERIEAERAEAERAEAERLEAERVEAERLEAERVEAERAEAERLEAERAEAERLEEERAEAERREAVRREVDRIENERLEAERLEAEKAEAVRRESVRREVERVEAERRETERAEAERAQAKRADAKRQKRADRERIVKEKREGRAAKIAEREKQRLARAEEKRRVRAQRKEARRAPSTSRGTSEAPRRSQQAGEGEQDSEPEAGGRSNGGHDVVELDAFFESDRPNSTGDAEDDANANDRLALGEADAPMVSQEPLPQPEDFAPEDSAAEDSAAEDSAAEDSAAEDSAVEDSAAEDSAAEDSAAEDSAAEDSAAEDSAAEDSAPEDSAAESHASEHTEPALVDVSTSRAGRRARMEPSANSFRVPTAEPDRRPIDVKTARSSRKRKNPQKRNRDVRPGLRIVLMAGALVVTGLVAAGVLVWAGDKGQAGNSDTVISGKNVGLSSPVLSPLPGTHELGQYAGIGSLSVATGQKSVPAGRTLIISVVCRGKGPVQVGALALPDCKAPVHVAADRSGLRSLDVTAPQDTRWRIALTDQPNPATNGALTSPPDSILDDPNAPDVVGVGASAGTATVNLRRPDDAETHTLRIALTCSGTGVTIRSATAALNGKYTRSCFDGWSYQFDVPDAPLPATFTVVAAKNTAWRLVVVTV